MQKAAFEVFFDSYRCSFLFASFFCCFYFKTRKIISKISKSDDKYLFSEYFIVKHIANCMKKDSKDFLPAVLRKFSMSSVQRSFFNGKKRAVFAPKNPRFFTFKPQHLVVSPLFYACPPQRVISTTDSTCKEASIHMNVWRKFSLVWLYFP